MCSTDRSLAQIECPGAHLLQFAHQRSPQIQPRPGTNASLLDNPTALALSGDKLYVADARTGWDRMVDNCEFRDLLWFCICKISWRLETTLLFLQE